MSWPSRLTLVRCPDLDTLGTESRRWVRGPHVAISGGQTFAALFPRWVRGGPFEDVTFFPVDERLVPMDHPASNWGVARRLLFEPLGRIRDITNFAVSAPDYGSLLRRKLGEPAVFDSALLGVGEDGHTASLFPGTPELEDREAPVLQTLSPKPPAARITLGLSVLWRSRVLVSVVAGTGKAKVVRRLLAGDRTLPITLALQGHPRPVLLLERSADPG